jgi:hypothetical protein
VLGAQGADGTGVRVAEQPTSLEERAHLEINEIIPIMAEGSLDPALSPDDFRAKRNYLPAEAFALVTGSYAGITDPIPEEQWHELMSGPTDVLLRTSDQNGTLSQPARSLTPLGAVR